jgi:hypothetical protein
MITADAYILARVVNRAALPDKNISGFGDLPAENLYSQSLAMRIAPVL